MLPELYRGNSASFIDHFFENLWQPTTFAPTVATVRQSRWASYSTEDTYVLETTVPEGVKTADIRAEVQDGMLRISIPRPQPQRIEVNEVVDAESSEDKS